MIFNNIKVPKKISPSPIAEAIVEVRFDTDIPPDAIIGIVFNELKEKYPKYEKLPIMELPPFVRENEPQFKFSPHYKLANKDFIFQIGPNCFSLANPKEYQGWLNYCEEIKWVFNQIKTLGLIEKPLRLGLRYINFFKNENIFEKTKIKLSLADHPLINCKNILRNEFDLNNFYCVVQLMNEALLEGKIKGSSVDIDVINNSDKIDILNNFETIINSAHDLEKRIFFGIIDENYLATLNPEY